MAELIYDEMILFGICLLVGAGLAFVYDCIRILRLLIPHKDVLVDIEDLGFWLFTAWMVFRTLFTYNRGALRAYAFLGMFLGVIVYALTLSRLLLFLVHKMLPCWKKCFHVLGKPFTWLTEFCRKTLKNAGEEVKIAIKGR